MLTTLTTLITVTKPRVDKIEGRHVHVVRVSAMHTTSMMLTAANRGYGQRREVLKTSGDAGDAGDTGETC